MNKETRQFIAYGFITLMMFILTLRVIDRISIHKLLWHTDTLLLILDLTLLYRYASKLSKTIR